MKANKSILNTSIAVGAIFMSSSAFAFTNIGFENLVNGQVVDDEYVLSDGVTISAINLNKNFDFAVVLDTGAADRDDDLEAPFRDFIESDFVDSSDQAAQSFSGDVRDGNNGIIEPGNILIIQENNIGCSDGICDEPDDEANRPNGQFDIEFDNPVFLTSIDFFDVEVEEDNSPEAQITLTTVTGSEIFFTPNTGGNFEYTAGMQTASGSVFAAPGPYNTWDRQFFNVAEVMMITINMGGSGGIDNILFSENKIPAPASIALTALGLLLLRRKIRR